MAIQMSLANYLTHFFLFSGFSPWANDKDAITLRVGYVCSQPILTDEMRSWFVITWCIILYCARIRHLFWALQSWNICLINVNCLLESKISSHLLLCPVITSINPLTYASIFFPDFLVLQTTRTYLKSGNSN